MSNLAPIILFCYNRLDHLKRTIEALQKNELAKESELFVFCDGAKNEAGLGAVKAVQDYVDGIDGFKKVVVEKRELNRGLAKSVIYGVSKILQKYERAIVLEDDIVVSPYFLKFMNDGLDFYEKDKRVFSVTGFNYPNYNNPQNYDKEVFFVEGRVCSWGWGTWLDRWNVVDFDVKDYDKIVSSKKMQKEFTLRGQNLFCILKDQMKNKIDAWDIQVTYHMFKNGNFCVFPCKTLVKNIGFDASGSHCHVDSSFVDFEFKNLGKVNLINIDDAKNNEVAEKEFIKFVSDGCFYKIFSRKKVRKYKNIFLGFVIGILTSFLLGVL